MSNEHNIESQFNACMHKEYCLSLKAKIRPLDENAPPAAAPAPAVPSVLKRGYGRLIQAAADLALQQFMPSDIVDDYPSKTISAAKVAKMMTQPRDRLRLLSIEVSEGAKQMIAATPAAPSQPAAPQGEPVAFAWRAKKGQPSAWQVCFDLKQADDAEVLAKTEIRFMSWTTPAAPSQEPAVPQGEPEAYMVYGNYTRQPFRSIESAQAYMGGLLKSDPEGGYHIRPLFYAATPAAPSQPVTLTDDDIARCINVATCGRPFIGLMNPGGVPSAFSRSLADLLIAATPLLLAQGGDE